MAKEHARRTRDAGVAGALGAMRAALEHRTAGISRDPARVRLEDAAGELDDEFPGFDVTTCDTWEGRALAAQRRGGSDGPGVYAVITPDPGEMRRVLEEDKDSPPEAPDG